MTTLDGCFNDLLYLSNFSNTLTEREAPLAERLSISFIVRKVPVLA